jgi:asparagine synthase (glutamine-hydrolysing)
MCGIAGVYNYGSSAPVGMDALRAMAGAMVHRGPDDEGFHQDGPLGLAFRRLSIIDLKKGAQPISNEDGSVWSVLNGEIYNYVELRESLERNGHRFRTNADSEVIPHLYEEYGHSFVEHLRGMFAIGLWDASKRQLLAVRDRLGIKPLYYRDRGGSFAFASEIKALLAGPAPGREVDLQALSDYITFRYVPAPATMFRGIFKVPPGHVVTVGDSGMRIDRYWDFDFESRADGDDRDLEERLRQMLRDCVRMRLMSDVPLGALLSGGIDSSMIVAFMSELMDSPVKTFSVGFDSAGPLSELPYARTISERFGTDHYEIVVGYDDMVQHLPHLVWQQDEPVTEPAAIPTYMVSLLARRHVVVVLTGEGADELFAGYPQYGLESWAGRYQRIPGAFRDRLIRPLVSSLPFAFRRLKVVERSLATASDADRWSSWFSGFSGHQKESLLSSDLASAVDDLTGERIYESHVSRLRAADPVERMLYADTKVWLPDDLLMKMDKMSMAASLEARVPYLDHKLVEFAASLPLRMKLEGLQGKGVLRRLAKDMLPKEIIRRKKVGFVVPINVWFRRELKPLLENMLFSERSLERGYFKHDYLSKLVTEHTEGRVDHRRELWTLVNLELWMRTFIDPPTPAPLEMSLNDFK